jgi:hypothetical protein
VPSLPILTPAKYAAASAVGYADNAGGLTLVSASAPLPVIATGAAVPTALAGSASTSAVVGGFAPARGVAVILALRGTWQGSVRLLRSNDGGVTLDPLTVAGAAWAQFTGNACEAVWEDNDPAATLYLGITLTSGTVNYRLGH